jgi:hypothetical protein
VTPLADHLTDCRDLGKARMMSRRLLPGAIRDARKAGATLGQLALVSGLSRTRIHQIVREVER